jgi:hypothetical protein
MLGRMVAGAVLLAFAAPALAESWDFVLVNKTGRTIKAVEIAPAGSEQWAKEKIEEDRPTDIPAGKDHTVHFEKDAKACKFDVRLTFKDDSTATAAGLDVCDYAFAEFSFKGETLAVKGS